MVVVEELSILRSVMPDYRIAITDRNATGVAVEFHNDMDAACLSVSRTALRIRADALGTVTGKG